MSWGWSDQTQKAIDFLNTGSIPSGLYISNTGSSGGLTLNTSQPASGSTSTKATTATLCSDSSQCASGFACIGGICVSTSGGTDGGTSTCDNSGSNGDGGAPGGGGGGCGGPISGSGGVSCVKSGCGTGGGGGGGGGNGSDCCSSERCCRMGAGFVQCFCGPCPPPPGCNQFCDSYAKANGAPAPGCDPNQCTECEACVTDPSGAGKCEPAGGPCWCPGSSCNGTCETCEEDGSCNENCANCLICVTLYNIPCRCGPFSLRCCYSACTEGLSPTNRCQIEAAKKCEERCPPPPPGPEPCDCNCHNDCPDCQLCGADGKCYNDTRCSYGTWRYRGIQNNTGTGDNTRLVATAFRNGIPGDPNAPAGTPGCEDGGCYPVPLGSAPVGDPYVFVPVGPQEPWGGSVTVSQVGDCRGSSAGCGMLLYNNGQVVMTLISTTFVNCADTLSPPEQAGCYMTGTWEFVPD